MDLQKFRPVALTAAACTAVQATVWFVLSIVGILAATHVIEGPESDSGSSWFPTYVYYCFLGEYKGIQSPCCYDLITEGTGILAISIVYLIISLIWLGAAAVLLSNLMNKEHLHTRNLTLVWVGITMIVCLLDLIVAILFGVDYHKLQGETIQYAGTTLYDCGDHLPAAGFLMSLVARGYVLWLINLSLAGLLAYVCTQGSDGTSQRWSRSSDSSVYNHPNDNRVTDSRSMVFQRADSRPWERSPATPQATPWNDGTALSPGWTGGGPEKRSPSPMPPATTWNPPSQAGNLVPRLPPAPSTTGTSLYGGSLYGGPQRGVQQSAPIPAPDYEAAQRGRPPVPASQPPPPMADPPKRSALKKTPPQFDDPVAQRWGQPQQPPAPARQWPPAQQPPQPQQQQQPQQNHWPSYDNRGYQPDGSGSRPPTGQWGRTGF